MATCHVCGREWESRTADRTAVVLFLTTGETVSIYALCDWECLRRLVIDSTLPEYTDADP